MAQTGKSTDTYYETVNHELGHAEGAITKMNESDSETFAQSMGRVGSGAMDNGLWMADMGGLGTKSTSSGMSTYTFSDLMHAEDSNGMAGSVAVQNRENKNIDSSPLDGFTSIQLQDQKLILGVNKGYSYIPMKSLEAVGDIANTTEEMLGRSTEPLMNILEYSSDKNLNAYLIYNGMQASSELSGVVKDKAYGLLSYGVDKVAGESNTLGKLGSGIDESLSSMGYDPYLVRSGVETVTNLAATYLGGTILTEELAGASKLGLEVTEVNNPIPESFARVVPGDIKPTNLGVTDEVFVTATEDIRGLNPKQLSEKLGIPGEDSFKIISFPSSSIANVASPVNRTNPGFVGKGLTLGGAREFIIPNQPIPEESKIWVTK